MFAPLKSLTDCMGYGQDATISASSGLPSIPTRTKSGLACTPRMAVIQCTGQNVRWRDDGTAPTASVGMTLVVGDTLYYDGDLNAIRFIEVTTTAVLNVSYYA